MSGHGSVFEVGAAHFLRGLRRYLDDRRAELLVVGLAFCRFGPLDVSGVDRSWVGTLVPSVLV
jgi:hypothetical protein